VARSGDDIPDFVLLGDDRTHDRKARGKFLSRGTVIHRFAFHVLRSRSATPAGLGCLSYYRDALRAYSSFKHGPGAFKVDFAVQDGIPWTSSDVRKAGTVHVGGDIEEVAAAELAVHQGRMPDRPFVLVGQQYLADPSRSVGAVHPLWTYAHVPHGFTGDATQAISSQIERFAPGFRDRIKGIAVRSTTEMSRYNENYAGGDIIGGASTPKQLIFRPRVAFDPYSAGIKGVWLCSASTPPGAGAHGMCGSNAAERALRHLSRR